MKRWNWIWPSFYYVQYESLKMCVFSRRLKVSTDGDCLTWSGSWFQQDGPAKANDRFPKSLVIIGTRSWSCVAERKVDRWCRSVTDFRNSDIYSGDDPLRDLYTVKQILKCTRSTTLSQWSFTRSGVMLSCVFPPNIMRAAAFRTCWTRWSW